MPDKPTNPPNSEMEVSKEQTAKVKKESSKKKKASPIILSYSAQQSQQLVEFVREIREITIEPYSSEHPKENKPKTNKPKKPK